MTDISVRVPDSHALSPKSLRADFGANTIEFSQVRVFLRSNPPLCCDYHCCRLFESDAVHHSVQSLPAMARDGRKGHHGLEMSGLLLAQSRHDEAGRACPLCPAKSDVDLFRHGEGIVDLDAEVAHSALNLRMPE